MAETDFFDEDLTKQTSPGTVASPLSPLPTDAPAQRPVNRDYNLAKMARHRDQLEGQVANTLQEIERLRQRQEDFENERRRLEDMRNKQDEYVRSKREVVQKLHQSLMMLEKEEVRASQMVDLYGSTRTALKNMLKDVQDVDETSWDPEDQQDDLTQATDLISAVRVELNKNLAKLDAFSGAASAAFAQNQGVAGSGTNPALNAATPLSFGRASLLGLAFGVPFSFLLLLGGLAAWWIIDLITAVP